jgi:intracellular sulfur oxidation DsrE/DsrF family protein
MKKQIIQNLLKSVLLSGVFFFGGNQIKAQSLPIAKSKHNIVMQLTSNDAKVHKGLVKQLNNLKDGWGGDLSVELVLHGPGVDFLRDSVTKFAPEIAKLKARGVVFAVCENSLRERKIDKSEIIAGHEYVKMGIGEIVLKQEEGWSYIKAGF